MWTSPKKSFCCILQGLGCPEPKMVPATTTRSTMVTIRSTTVATTTSQHFVGYECVGSADHWTATKRAWCCKHKQTGCTASTTRAVFLSKSMPDPMDFDCSEGLDLMSLWTPAKTNYCCAYKNVGCPNTHQKEEPLAQAAAFKVEEQPSTTEKLSDEQRIAMLEALMRKEAADATTSTTLYMQFDCEAGKAMWNVWWSDQKKEWCCKHMDVACPPTTTQTVTTTATTTTATETQAAKRSHKHKDHEAIGVRFQRLHEAAPSVSTGEARRGAWLLGPCAVAFMGVVAAVAGLRAISSECKRPARGYASMASQELSADPEAFLCPQGLRPACPSAR